MGLHFAGLRGPDPAVAQTYRPVEDWFVCSRIGIDAEVALSLKLKMSAGFSQRQRRFHTAGNQSFQ